MTNAELTAWSYGVRLRQLQEAGGGSPASLPAPGFRELTTAQLAAVECLGADLFVSWAERGYAAPPHPTDPS